MNNVPRRARLDLLVRFAGVVVCFAPAVWSAPVLTDVADIKVSVGGSEVEDHIAVSPLDPKTLFVSDIRIDTGLGVKTWVSQDAGKTWRKFGGIVSGAFDPIGAISPHVGTVGRFLVGTVQGEIDVDYKDTLDSTVSLTHVVVAPNTSSDWDKDYLWVDDRATGSYAKQVYCGFSDLRSPDKPNEVAGRVYAQYSTDNGATWSSRVAVDADTTEHQFYMGINLATAADGRVYAAWVSRELTVQEPAKAFMFRYSTTGGASWTSPTNGHLIMPLQGFARHRPESGKTMRTTVSPSMAVAGDGDIYVVFADKESGRPDTDIYILKSEDQGATWKVPGGSGTGYKRVNAGGTGTANQDQWFPWIAWDDGTGALVVVYYDSRENTSRVNTYVAVSYDEGVTWNSGDEFKVSDADWDGDPPNSAFGDDWAGDYIGVAARDGIAYPVWSDDRVTSDSYRVYTSPIFVGGIESTSLTASVGHHCEGVYDPRVRFDVQWSTLVGTDVDSLVVIVPTSPNPTTYGCETTNQGTSHQLVLYDIPCVSGTWTYRIVSKKGAAVSRPGPMTKAVTCISCPPPCRPPCEFE